MNVLARTAQAWSMQSDRIIRLKTVLARTGLSRSTMYRMIKSGTFPRQIRIGAQGAGWHVAVRPLLGAEPQKADEGLSVVRSDLGTMLFAGPPCSTAVGQA